MTTLDARGLLCPLPLTLAKQRMAGLAAGATLVGLATDPEGPSDIAAWAAAEGHGYAERERDGYREFELVKRARG